MADSSVVDGSVTISDYTAGRRAPVTVSRLGNMSFLWGRQDFIVYLTAVPVFMFLVATVRAWWPLLAQPLGGVTGGVVSVAILLVVPAAAGWGVSLTGVRTRDLPRLALRAGASLALPFLGDVSGSRAVRREPHLPLTLETYVIPSDAFVASTLVPEA